MADRKIALGVAPNAAPARPIAVDPAVGISAPIGRNTAIFDLEIVNVAPDSAGKIGIRCGDDDFAFFASRCAPPAHAAGVCACKRGSGRCCISVLDPNFANDPRQGIGMGICLQRKVCIAVEMGPRDAAMLGRPIAVNILWCDMVHAELLD